MRDKMQVTGILIAAMAAGYLGGLMSQANTAAVAAGTGPVTSEVVRATEFELVDAEGKVRGAFRTTVAGDPMLALYDSAGELRGVFSTVEGEPRLVLLNSAGKERGLFGTVEGEPRLVLRDSAGELRGGFSTIEGEPGLVLYDSAGELRGVFSTIGGESRLILLNSAGKTVWSAP